MNLQEYCLQRGHLRFHGGPAGLEMLGLETTAGTGNQFPSEKPLGPVVTLVVVPTHPAKPVGFAKFFPTIGRIDGAGELLGIDEGFNDQS